MNVDQKAKIYNEGFASGQAHTRTAPETHRLLAKIQDGFVLALNEHEKKEITMSSDLRHQIEGVSHKIYEIKELVDKIPEMNERVRLTNGRVTKLEDATNGILIREAEGKHLLETVKKMKNKIDGLFWKLVTTLIGSTAGIQILLSALN